MLKTFLPIACFVGLALVAVPPATADPGPVPDCTTTTVGIGAYTFAVVSYGTSCGLAIQPYTCDLAWYGGHGIGGFIPECSPGLRPPCVFPVCRP